MNEITLREALLRRPVIGFLDANWLGHSLRVVEVARTLRRAGVEVELAGRGRFAHLLRSEGFPVHVLPGSGSAFRPRRWGRVGLSWFGECGSLGDQVRAGVELLRERGAAAVLFDYCPTANLSAEAAGVPSISLLNANYTRYVDLGQARLLPAWLEPTLPVPVRSLLFRAATRLMVLPLNRVRREWDLAPWPDFFSALSGQLNLVCDSATLAGATRLPRSHRLIGPILVQPTAVETVPGDLLARRPVFVTLGSNSYPRLLDELVDTLAGTGLPTVVSAPDPRVREGLRLAPRVHAFGLVDNLEVMRHARCVVCHGGAGTVYQALAVATPVVAVPLNHGQHFYADRLEALRLGRSLSRERVAAELGETLTLLCADVGVRLRLQEMAKEVSVSVAAAEEAARLILELCGERALPNTTIGRPEMAVPRQEDRWELEVTA